MRKVHVKAIGRKIDFVGIYIAESTSYFFNIIFNFIFKPLMAKKIFEK